jgi:hypothetical protein
MNTFFVAILFVCVEGVCNFVTTDRVVYSSANVCVTELQTAAQRIKEKYPDMVAKGTCMAVRLGEV